MKPIEFKGHNTVYAKNQPQYIPLPAHKSLDGIVTSCWTFTLWERIKILLGAKVYWSQMTFNKPLQPQKPSLEWRN